MTSLREALVKAGIVDKEQAKFEEKLEGLPDALRPLARRFNDLKGRWLKLPGATKLLLALNFIDDETVQGRKTAFELAIKALEEVPE